MREGAVQQLRLLSCGVIEGFEKDLVPVAHSRGCGLRAAIEQFQNGRVITQVGVRLDLRKADHSQVIRQLPERYVLQLRLPALPAMRRPSESPTLVGHQDRQIHFREQVASHSTHDFLPQPRVPEGARDN